MEFGIGTLHGGLEGRRYGAQNCKQAGNTPAPEPYAAFRLPCIPFMRGPCREGFPILLFYDCSLIMYLEVL